MPYDPHYKLKHRVTPIRRLVHYKRLPPPMVGDPHVPSWTSWHLRCLAIYNSMMAKQRNVVADHKQRGLWAWDIAP